MKQLVYAMRDCETQLVKIGISVDPSSRTLDVATQFSNTVELLGTLEVEDARKVEQFLHSALSGHRVMGEWFQPDAKTLSYVLAFFVKPEQPSPPKSARRTKKTTSLVADAAEGHLEKPIRDELQFEMLKQGITQTALAAKLTISRGHLNNIIKGKAEASFELWQAIAKELGYELLRHYELVKKG